MKNRAHKVLLVGMLDSIHVARWLKLNAANNLEVLLFASSPMRRVNPLLRKLIAESNVSNAGLRLAVHQFAARFAIPLWLLDRMGLFDGRLRGFLLRQAIRNFDPDLVHTMESQNGGYSTDQALKALNSKRPKTLLTLFGSDLYWYSRFTRHRKRLSTMLSHTDFLQVECQRDEDLARALGFKGEIIGPMPVAGGLVESDLYEANDLKDEIETRRKIAIKGYGGRWGKAHVAIEELAKVASSLEGFEIVVFSASKKVVRLTKKLFAGTKIILTFHKKFELSHDEMLQLFRASRFYIGLSKSDGLPASMLEAMSQGAFPVQSNTACIDGWFEDGRTGIAVDLDDTARLAARIVEICGDHAGLGYATARNLETISSRYSRDHITSVASQMYTRVLSET